MANYFYDSEQTSLGMFFFTVGCAIIKGGKAIENYSVHIETMAQEHVDLVSQAMAYSSLETQGPEMKGDDLQSTTLESRRILLDTLKDYKFKKNVISQKATFVLEEENALLHAEINDYYHQLIENRKRIIVLMRDLFCEKTDNLTKDQRLSDLEVENMHLKVEVECLEKAERRKSKENSDLKSENTLLKERLEAYQSHQQEDLFAARKRALDNYAKEYEEDYDDVDYAYRLQFGTPV